MAEDILEAIDREAKTFTFNGELHSYSDMEVKFIGQAYVTGAKVQYSSKDKKVSFCKVIAGPGSDLVSKAENPPTTPKESGSLNHPIDSVLKDNYWVNKGELDRKRDKWLGWQGALSIGVQSVASLASKNTDIIQNAEEIIKAAEFYHNFLKSKTS